MEIIYSETQHNALMERMQFLNTIHTMLLIVGVILGAMTIAGIAFIAAGFTVLGVIIALIATPIFGISIAFVLMLGLLRSTISKRKYKVFKVTCKKVEPVAGSSLWLHVDPTEVLNLPAWLYTGDPGASLKPGETYELIIRENNKTIRFGTLPL